MHQAQEDIGHRGQHSAAGHHATKAHCADNEPYRCEHSRHSARSNQVVQLGTARLDRCRSVAAGQHTLKSREKVERLDTGNLGENFGLRNHQRHTRHNARGEEGDNGGQFTSDKHSRKQRHEQQPGRDIEGLLEARRHSHCVARIGVIHDHSSHRKDYECHHKRRNRRTHHIADMRKNRHLNGRRCEHRRIGQNRDLITEICTRDDCSGDPALLESEGVADTHQRNADGGDCRPRTTRNKRHQSTYHARSDQEKRRMQHLKTVIDKCRHHATHHPRSGDCADKQQDDNTRSRGVDIIENSLLQAAPTASVDSDCNHHTDRCSREQSNLATAHNCITAEALNYQHQHRYQHSHRYCRDPRSRLAKSSLFSQF